jgi:hypothetical protein
VARRAVAASKARRKPAARKKSAPASSKPARTAISPVRVTPAQYARHRGVSREAVSKALREGRIRADSRGLIERAEADASWVANTSTRPGQPAGPGPVSVDAYIPSIDGVSLTDARTMHELTKARIAALQLAREMGDLVSAAEVRDQVSRSTRTARDLFESIPDRIADTLAGMTDGDSIRKLLRDELENALDALASAGDLKQAGGAA